MSHLLLRLPERALARRPVVDRRRFRSGSRLVPFAIGGRPAPGNTRLEADFLRLMADDPAVASIHARPETYSWRDGHDGRRHTFAPDHLVVMTNGAKVYRSIRRHMALLRDPDFSGCRTRIELECAARGGTFEIWTEREIKEPTNGWPLLRVATFREADELEQALRELGEFGFPKPPSLVTRVAERLGLSQPRQVGRTFLARSRLTGILMAILCDLRADLETGALVWKATPRTS